MPLLHISKNPVQGAGVGAGVGGAGVGAGVVDAGVGDDGVEVGETVGVGGAEVGESVGIGEVEVGEEEEGVEVEVGRGLVEVGTDVVVGTVVGVAVFDDECKMRTKITTNEITQHIPQQMRKRDSAVLLFLFFFFCLKSSLGFDEDGATSDSLSIFWEGRKQKDKY